MTISAVVAQQYPQLVAGSDYTIAWQDGQQIIATWNSTTIAQPTAEALTEALDAATLSTVQQAQIAKIAVPYQAALVAPVSYLGTEFAGDLATQNLISHAMVVFAAVGSTPDGFYFVDADGNKVLMNLAQLQGLGAAFATSYFGVFQKWTDLQEQVMAATTAAAVQAVVWS